MERLLQDIIDILPVGVWVTDANGRFVRANPAARAIWRGTGPLQHADGDRFDAWWRQDSWDARAGAGSMSIIQRSSLGAQ